MQAPVTLVIRRRVRAGHEAAYEAWLARMQASARDLPGYLGVITQTPAVNHTGEYLSFVRFDSQASLEAFESSEFRRRHLAELGEWVDGDALVERRTGLEFWFPAPTGPTPATPIRWRMAVLLTLVVYGLVLVIGNAVNVVLPSSVPSPVRLLVTIALEVALMTYWLMPRLTRLLAGWLFPRPASR